MAGVGAGRSYTLAVPAPRPALTRERIIDAARVLIDDDGLDALSMRKLGASLGVEAMSLYNHVDNKDDVLDGVLESLLAEVDIPAAELPWRVRLRDLALAFRAVATSHPAMIPLFSSRRVRSERGWAPLVCAYEILRGEGLEPADAVDAFFTAASFVLGFALTEVGALAELRGTRLPDDLGSSDAAVLVELGGELLGTDPDRRFESGLDLILAGLERRIAATRGPAGV